MRVMVKNLNVKKKTKTMTIKNIPVVEGKPLDSLRTYLCVLANPQSRIQDISEITGLTKTDVLDISSQYTRAGIFRESYKMFGKANSLVYSVKDKPRMLKFSLFTYGNNPNVIVNLLKPRVEVGKTDAAAWG
jgi:hypothetical protein